MSMMGLIVLPWAFLLISGVAPSNEARAGLDQSGPQESETYQIVHGVAGDDLCSATRLTLSPDGTILAPWKRAGDSPPEPKLPSFPTDPRDIFSGVWKDPNAAAWSVAFVDADCLIEGNEACATTGILTVNDPVGLVWRPSGDAVVIDRGGETAEADFGAGTNIRRLPDRVSVDEDFQGFSGLVDGLTDLAEVKDLNPDPTRYRRGSIHFSGDRIRATALDRRTHKLTLFDRGRGDRRTAVTEVDVSAHWTDEEAIWVEGPDGATYLVGGASFHRLDGIELTPVFPHLTNPSPIFDSTTAKVVGAFDDDEILWLSGDGIKAPSDLNFISDVSVSSGGGRVSLVYRTADGRHHLDLRKVDGAALWSQDCGVDGEYPAFHVTNEDWGTPDRPLAVRRVALEGPARGEVVVWQGGPGGTFARGRKQYSELAWLERGFNVNTIEASGSAGIDLHARLRTEGFAALLRDAAAASSHADREFGATTSIIIEGSSFGATAAATMAGDLKQRNGSSRPVGLLLLSPWLRYRDPTEYGASYDFYRLNPDFARAANETIFGPMHTPGGEGFADDQARWRAAFHYNGPTLAIFGETDRISRAEDFWATPDAAVAPLIHVVPRMGHGLAADSREASAAISRWIETILPATASR